MGVAILALFALYRYTPGRRAWMIKRIREIAEAAGLQTIVARCDALHPNELDLAEQLRLWAEVRGDVEGKAVSQKLVVLDQRRDGLLGDFGTLLTALGRLAARPEGKAALRLLPKLFPDGTRAVITLPYPDETAAVDAIVAWLEGELAADAATAGCTGWTAEIKDANAAFSEAYDRLTAKRQLEWSELRAKDSEAQERFLVLLCHVIDTCYGTPTLAELLDPVEVQQAAMKALYKSRRAVPDVDPESGELVEAPAEDASG